MGILYPKYKVSQTEWEKGKPAKSLEGKVTKCYISGGQFFSDYFSPPSTHFEVDSLNGMPLKISGASLRLDLGEVVRVHSVGGFNKPYPYCEVDAIEILDSSSKTIFYYVRGSEENTRYVFEIE